MVFKRRKAQDFWHEKFTVLSIDEEKQNLDITELSKKVATSVCLKEGKKSYYENDFIV